MAQYQINVDSQLLHQLFLGNSQDAGVAKLLESVLNQVLQAQVSEQVYETANGFFSHNRINFRFPSERVQDIDKSEPFNYISLLKRSPVV